MFSNKDYEESIKVSLGLKIIGLELELAYQDKLFLMNEISSYIFDTSITNNGKKVFDLEQDYKYYFIDFLKLGINLNKDNISWWEFDSILEGIFLNENSAISKVLQYRTYEKPSKNSKTSEQKEHRFYMEKKRQYALKIADGDTTKGFEKLSDFLSKKVVKKNE